MKKICIYLTDTSKANLVEAALAKGYIKREDNINVRGLSEYLSAVSLVPLADNRPPYALGSDEWFRFSDEARNRTLLSIETNAYIRLLAKAASLKCHNRRKATLIDREPASLLGALIEALGSGWVIPLAEPKNKPRAIRE